MKKKLLSLVLAGSVAASMAAIAATSASALIDPDGSYTPGEGIETKRVYFTMPDSWKNSYTNSAGCYWWAGTDACGAIDGSGGSLAWPGYKAKYDASLEDKGVKTLYYLDIPDDVPTVVWNNYLDGGMDESAPQYTAATQCKDSACEYLSEGDVDIYDDQDGFWEEMEDSFNGDKAALGSFADNFFESEYGIAFTMDNMIWVPDLTHTDTSVSGKITYYGDWYFYYGDGTYGTYPTKEAAQEKGTVGDLAASETPTQPTTVPATTSPSTTVAPTTDPATSAATDPSASAIATTPTSSNNDATSAVGAKASTADTAKSTTSDNGSVKTGAASLAVILLVVLSGAGSVVYFTRRRNSK